MVLLLRPFYFGNGQDLVFRHDQLKLEALTTITATRKKKLYDEPNAHHHDVNHLCLKWGG